MNLGGRQEDSHKRLLSKRGLQPGRAVDLGTVRLRQDAAVSVRVVGIWSRGQREPWRLATNLEEPLARIAALFGHLFLPHNGIRALTPAALRDNIPAPTFRSFPWLEALQPNPC